MINPMNSMNSLEQLLTNASTGMSAQSVRMNVIASNLANADSVGTTEEGTYHTKYPVFSEIQRKAAHMDHDDQPTGGVRVSDILHSTSPLEKRYDPENPMANNDGYVYVTDVNPVEELTNMIDASKAYQADAEVINTTKNMIMQSNDVLRS